MGKLNKLKDQKWEHRKKRIFYIVIKEIVHMKKREKTALSVWSKSHSVPHLNLGNCGLLQTTGKTNQDQISNQSLYSMGLPWCTRKHFPLLFLHAKKAVHEPGSNCPSENLLYLNQAIYTINTRSILRILRMENGLFCAFQGS